VQVVNSTGKY
jgi:hypothetical protein